VIDHLIRTFHDKPATTPTRTDGEIARIRRHFSPESRAPVADTSGEKYVIQDWGASSAVEQVRVGQIIGDIDRVLAHLDEQIAQEQTEMDALLVRLRSSPTAA
jgi:hypothetical protein